MQPSKTRLKNLGLSKINSFTSVCYAINTSRNISPLGTISSSATKHTGRNGKKESHPGNTPAISVHSELPYGGCIMPPLFVLKFARRLGLNNVSFLFIAELSKDSRIFYVTQKAWRAIVTSCAKCVDRISRQDSSGNITSTSTIMTGRLRVNFATKRGKTRTC